MQLIQTYKECDWKEGVNLQKSELLDKETAHSEHLLHASAHLLMIDEEENILCRKRNANDDFYPGLWTSAIGTHILPGETPEDTIRKYLPLDGSLVLVGEFRVNDPSENEVNTLFVLKVRKSDLKQEYLKESNREFIPQDKLGQLIHGNMVTPHLKGAYELYKRKSIIESESESAKERK